MNPPPGTSTNTLTAGALPEEPAFEALVRRSQVVRIPPATRFGAIDIGTNSIHYVLVDISPEGNFQVIGSDKEMVRLGRGGFARGELTPEAMELGITSLRRFMRIAALKGVTKLRAVATSAVRESRNGGDFVERVRDELGLEISVISVAEEGRLIYLGVQHEVDLGTRDNLIVDIGGGSVELIVGSATEAKRIRSVKLGGSRLAELFLHADPYAADEVKALRGHVRTTLTPVLGKFRTYHLCRCLGTSGTIRSLAALCARRRDPDRADVDSTRLDRNELKGLIEMLRPTTRAQRTGLPGMDAARIDGALPAAIVLHEIMKNLKIATLEYCASALREGVIVDYIGTHRHKLLARATWPDPRMRSVRELAQRCNYASDHADHVARLAVRLFDACAPLHRLDGAYRELLHVAGILHDIGHHIGHQAHHKHSYYLISNGRLKDFSAQEVQVIANVARYHRKDRPRKSHYSFQQLAPEHRTPVRKLAALLRLAEALDRTHAGVVDELSCKLDGDTVHLLVHTDRDAELELWTARRCAEVFEREFDKSLIVRTAFPWEGRPTNDATQ